MKAIILAAGRGSRLSKYTKNIPKGLLQFGGMSLIERQIMIMKKLGIKDISIVKGYMNNKITFSGIDYFHNKNFLETNMVESLFSAEEKLNSGCIVCYSDIIYEKEILEKVIEAPNEIGVVVDRNFKTYWKKRLGKEYNSDMESMIIRNNEIVSLGNPNPSDSEINGRYVGIIKFSDSGIKKLKYFYDFFKGQNKISKFGNREFKKWHMTDLLEAMINEGCSINPIYISRGWLEFDTDNDYENYNLWFEEKTLNNFINI